MRPVFGRVYAHPVDRTPRITATIIKEAKRKVGRFSRRSALLPNGECLLLTLSNIHTIIF